jgi:hypothetical protein
LLYFSTYAMHRISAMSVMLSSTFNCILMLISIVVPVEALSVESEKYPSAQLVIYVDSLLTVRPMSVDPLSERMTTSIAASIKELRSLARHAKRALGRRPGGGRWLSLMSICFSSFCGNLQATSAGL